MTNKSNFIDYLNQFSNKLEIEIEFFVEQIRNNLDYLSAFNRYVIANEEYINTNPDKEYVFFEFAYNQYHSYFPYIVNNSLLITFDSYFDSQFYLLTKNISTLAKTKFKAKNRGTHIYECFRFLKNNFGVQISETNKNWVSIKNNHRIRNLIVHHNSNLLKSQGDNISLKEIEEIKKHKDFDLVNNCKYIDLIENSGNFYIKENEFLIEYLTDIKNFFKTAIEEIKTVHNKQDYERSERPSD